MCIYEVCGGRSEGSEGLDFCDALYPSKLSGNCCRGSGASSVDDFHLGSTEDVGCVQYSRDCDSEI